MGLGFVLLVWAVLLACGGVPVAVGLGVWSWRNRRRSLTERWPLSALAAAALPFVLLAYGSAAFLSYAFWCESVRHVDAGIGDTWAVPVGNDHFFCMIDEPDRGYLIKSGCTGVPAVSGIAEIAAVGDRIVGNSQSSGPFLFDTRSSELKTFSSLDAALGQFSPHPTLQTAHSFYLRRRWQWADLAAVALISVPAVGILIGWYRWFIRAPQA